MKSTSKETSIRKAKMQDVAALKRCIERAYAPVKARLSDLPDVSAGLEEDIATKTVLVTETGGKISGCIILNLDGVPAQLENVAVDPDFKGLGLGRKLMEKAEEFACKSGATAIQLATHANMPENVSLYSHLGWSETLRTGNKIMMKKDL
ncbi:GNAT family N-acetyltransferase [Labrenzia sp. DG1229]|uniref:GNAT family N-acetyltransferase n=1 Tax=Labrenzia sp. DG1229 TaxID=681847 RepID=UPI000B09D299|nr:GNAT family N-acetyltransferase [Labrenzia sp. DG1229]